jgi:HD-like signal output (HDOD) protein
LPPAPVFLTRLMVLLNQPDTDTTKVVDLITYDPALTTNVVRRCNSAYYGFASPVDNVQEAVTRLGFWEIYRIVVMCSTSRMLSPAQKGYGMEANELWDHSIATALAAEQVAKDLHEDEATAFTAGL